MAINELSRTFAITVLLSISGLTNVLCAQSNYLMTVNGKVPASDLTMALIHEHVVTNFAGADSVKFPGQQKTAALKIILPYFNTLKQQGINALFECTPAYIGRDPELLKEISVATNINIITNTGYYAAVDKRYIPDFIYNEPAEKIAKRWEEEFYHGIDQTGIRPGFIKLGVGNGAMDSLETKLLVAAIAVSKKTGLAIAVHTGDYAAAFSEYQLALKENLDPGKLIWVHAQNASNEQRKFLAEKGMWISMDNVNALRLEEYADAIIQFKENNLLHRLLISHDDGWSVLSNGSYDSLELFNNGNTIPYLSITTKLLPLLKKKGFTDENIRQVMKDNPASCFGLKE